MTVGWIGWNGAELAERLVGLRDGAEWAILAKNGTDVTSAAKLAARAGTGRKLVLREAATPAGHSAPYWAYHGAHSWMRGAAGVLPEVSSDFEVPYTFNDLESVRTAVRRDEVLTSFGPHTCCQQGPPCALTLLCFPA